MRILDPKRLAAKPIVTVAFALALSACNKYGFVPEKSKAPTVHSAALVDPVCGPGHTWSGKGCSESTKAEAEVAITKNQERTLAGGLKITDYAEGSGVAAKRGDTVRVHYTGTLEDGTMFDSSKERDAPLEFELGKGMVIRGFDRGVEGMKVGSKRKVWIPYDLGYGERGAPPKIPPKANLTFELELVGII
ncbi:MAG: FKBP-type peptidyl-prolyl cis-trans isomerase [Polyangiaceae bacterium]|nr:FKBP-type peptidyl-prolyl cis-trans isomerase [Polyangiaceae bacterium]